MSFRTGKISTLANMTKDWSAAVIDVSVGHKADVDKVISVMTSVAGELRANPAFSQKITGDIEVFGVDSITENAIIIKGRLKTKPMAQWDVGSEYRKRLRTALDKAGVDIPCPRRVFVMADKAVLEGAKP